MGGGSITEIVDAPFGVPGKMIVLSHDDNTARWRSGDFDQVQEIHLMRQWLAEIKEPVLLDIGAHAGLFCFGLQYLCRTVHAWEPQRIVFNLLAGNIALNSWMNVWPHWEALGEHCGEIPLPTFDYTKTSNFGGIEFGERFAPNGGIVGQDPLEWNGEMVPVRTLDSYSFSRVDVIKLDAEGMELPVLRGGVATIRRCHPKLVIEHVKVGIDNITSWLQPEGYTHFEDLGGDVAAWME